MTQKVYIPALVLMLCLCESYGAFAQKIHNKQFKYSITLPDGITDISDSANSPSSSAYFDSSAGVMLMLSARKSRFREVKEYIDCSHLELEQQLQSDYGDSSLRLLSCNKPDYYPGKTTLIRFEITSLAPGYSAYMIYFIHHRRYDIQVSFAYKKENEARCAGYIKSVMETLVLK